MAGASLDAQLAELERITLRAIAGKFTDDVGQLRVMVAMSSPKAADLIRSISAPQANGLLARAIQKAHRLGMVDTIQDTGDKTLNARSRRWTTPKRLIAGLDLDATGRDAVSDAKRLLLAGASNRTAAAPLFAHEVRLRRTVRGRIMTAANTGVTRVADEVGLPTVWVAETNACVHCLAYSGQTADPGKKFPGGLSYAATSPFGTSLPVPPLHPFCRCIVEMLSDPRYAMALRREADRSVLRGFSLESESMRVRVDAAERLLARGPHAPKTVIQYAEGAVSSGEFKTRGRRSGPWG